MRKSDIEHEGLVVAKELGILIVDVEVQSACGACHAKGHCAIAESGASRRISVKDHGTHQIGDKIIIVMGERQGFEAVFLAYIWPFLIVMISVILGVAFLDSELMAGVLAILILAPYYLILYLFRNQIKKKFLFHLKSQ